MADQSTKQPSISRRTFTAGGAAVLSFGQVVLPTITQGATPMADTLIDPRNNFPKPPFKRQSQPWPGLARDMDPRPDHGETT